jgi:hypothetical protein
MTTVNRLITFADAARLASNSSAWWRKLAARGAVPTVKLGRSTRLRIDDVERVIRDGVRPCRSVR